VPRTPRLARLAAVGLGALVVVAGAAAPVSATASHAQIQGSGSSWSSNAVNQWIADVEPNGLQVIFTPSGSAQGRKDFAYQTTDFAVSDIGYLGHDPATGDVDTSQGRAFAYLPVVAGGTAFPYQVLVGGKLVRNIRLSGLSLAKIFTNQITNWADPAITKDNNGRQLPSLPIIPVVHSEGSGSTAQFTRYLAKQYPALWQHFSGSSAPTEYFPRTGSQIAQNGSDGVINFLTSSAGNGSIGYDEYSYALSKNYPVVKLQNTAGYFTAPTQYNTAVALTRAVINMDKSSPDYLLQDLDNVYVDTDKRTYPLSSYSYMIIPTAANDGRMTTAKRQTIADFLYYSVCQGQAEMGPIGYSPLPINLVQASFDQVSKLKQADPGVDLTKRDVSTCHNPTFVAGQPKRNYLAEIAPYPPACDKAGAGPCTGSEGLTNGNPIGGSKGGVPRPPEGTTSGTGGGSTGGGSATGTTGATSATTGAVGTTGAVAVDPVTGQTITPAGGSTGAGGADAAAVPTSLSASELGASSGVLGAWAVVLLLAAILVPPVVAARLRRARAPQP
jgi:phosphate transport system substrate-binding protein